MKIILPVADLKAHNGAPENIADASIDMSKAFIKGIKEQLPTQNSEEPLTTPDPCRTESLYSHFF